MTGLRWSIANEVDAVLGSEPAAVVGRVAALRGLTLLVRDLPMPVGTLVSIRAEGAKIGSEPARDPGVRALGEVVGFDESRAIVMLLGEASGLRPGDLVVTERREPTVPSGEGLLGRVVDAMGTPIDGGGPLGGVAPAPMVPQRIRAMDRARISRPLRTGVRAVDLMTPMGRGQRVGVFAGPGVGKSTLLGSIALRTDADVNVIALIGERGREVREFVEDALGEAGLARSVVVTATSDESPLMRIRAAKAACAIAESFRDRGLDVLLMMDSVTRFAHAQRQVGLAVGEPPTTKGYTPSVFAELPLLLERAGALEGSGSITGLYTVLVEGDDLTEPIADAARGILDGHVVLSRRLAQKGHFPAIDVLDSVSRVADHVSDGEHRAAWTQAKRLLASFADVEELIQIGAYAQGADPTVDVAVAFMPRLRALLQQESRELADFEVSRRELLSIAMESGEFVRRIEASRAAGGATA
ncbi:MAG: FliI/YscN family ATPase [Planctomycetota bacterium]